MLDRASDMRHILAQVQLITGGSLAEAYTQPSTPPERLYHVVGRNWRKGEPLRSLYRLHGDAAYGKWAKRWPEGGDMGFEHAHLIFFYNTLDEARDHLEDFGNSKSRILIVDADRIECRWDTLERHWCTADDVPPDAILGVVR